MATNQYQCKDSLLAQGQQGQLKQLFDHAGWELLEKVIEGRAKRLEVNALNAQAQTSQFEKYDAKALGELRAAAKYRTALEVLQEVAAETKPFSVVEQIQ